MLRERSRPNVKDLGHGGRERLGEANGGYADLNAATKVKVKVEGQGQMSRN